MGLLWCGDSLPGPVQGYALNVFKILFPALYAILDQMVNQIIGKMKHIRKIKNGFHLGGRQGSANVGLCNKEELCGFLREQKLQRVGVFRFSPEEGTLAAKMEPQVDPETAARRVELVVDLQSRIMDEYNQARLGTVMEVLCEGFDSAEGCYAGRTYADSVDIDGRVLFTAAGLVPAGEFVNVRITGVSDGDLTGEIER